MAEDPKSGIDDSDRFITPRPSPKMLAQSKALLRARTRLIVSFWTLPVYIAAIWVLLNNGRNIDTLMYIYMGMWGGFAIDMVRRLCPSCHRQFFVKTILMNLRTRSCVHCGFDSRIAAQSVEGGRSNEEKVTF